MHPYAKFGALILIIVATLGWLAMEGVSETKTYYKTIEEMTAMGNEAQVKRLRVGGDVEVIERNGQEVKFRMIQKDNGKNLTLNVVYNGKDPLPDTFRVGAQALADGKMGTNGVFQASRIQAKCASKYEAKPGVKPGNTNSYAKPATS
jgi:cytochrome c-type biogenesis protein CcmE